MEKMVEQIAPRQRVLLLDDDPLILETLGGALRLADFEVCVASEAGAAFAEASKALFGIAIIDYSLPGENGLVLASRLTKIAQPFMFLSAYHDDVLVESAIAAGALAYVVKPIDPIRIIPAVRAAARRAHELTALLERVDRLTSAIETNRNVSVAVGLLMAQRGLTREAAYETLRQHSRRTRRRLPDVALGITAAADTIFGLPAVESKRGAPLFGAPFDDEPA